MKESPDNPKNEEATPTLPSPAGPEYKSTRIPPLPVLVITLEDLEREKPQALPPEKTSEPPAHQAYLQKSPPHKK